MSIDIDNVVRVEDPSGPTYFLGTILPSQIKELTFVPVVEKSLKVPSLNEKDEMGYQRAGDADRMKEIKDFLMTNANRIIPPVVLSARGKWAFSPYSERQKHFGKLTATEQAAIIDGQHRLGGLWMLVNDDNASQHLKNRPISFMLIEDMQINDEQGNFIDVNENQKGVKKSLLKYLQKDNNFNAQVANALMLDDESVFKDRIGLQKKEDWSIVLFGALEETVAELFDRDFVTTTGFRPADSPENRQKAISFAIKYWTLVKKVFAEQWFDMEQMPAPKQAKSKEFPGTRGFQWRLLEETGIRAFARLGSQILRTSWVAAAGVPAWDQVEERLQKVAANQNALLALTKPTRDADTKAQIRTFDPDLLSTGKAGVRAIFSKLNDALITSS